MPSRRRFIALSSASAGLAGLASVSASGQPTSLTATPASTSLTATPASWSAFQPDPRLTWSRACWQNI